MCITFTGLQYVATAVDRKKQHAAAWALEKNGEKTQNEPVFFFMGALVGAPHTTSRSPGGCKRQPFRAFLFLLNAPLALRSTYKSRLRVPRDTAERNFLEISKVDYGGTPHNEVMVRGWCHANIKRRSTNENCYRKKHYYIYIYNPPHNLKRLYTQ